MPLIAKRQQNLINETLTTPTNSSPPLPTAVNAESHWLILTYGQGFHHGGKALEKIEMPDGETCEKEGRKWEQSLTQSALQT